MIISILTTILLFIYIFKYSLYIYIYINKSLARGDIIEACEGYCATIITYNVTQYTTVLYNILLLFILKIINIYIYIYNSYIIIQNNIKLILISFKA